MNNIGAYIEAVADHYHAGRPKKRNGHEIRYGNNGSLSVDTKKGTWWDNELSEGGGVIDMVRFHEGAGLASVSDILERKFGIPKRTQEKLKTVRHHVADYDYYNQDGELVYQVQRFAPKTFRQRRPDGNGGWIYNMKDVEAQPYNLPEIMLNPNKTIFIVEGEKCADKLNSLGGIATTSHGGAGNWKPELNWHFKDRKVVILPDRDDAGDKHAKQVINNLIGIASEIKRVDLPGLSDKQDVYDWFNNGGTVEQLKDLVRSHNVVTTPQEVTEDNQKQPNETFPVMSISDLRNMPPVQWLIDDVITSYGLTVLYGAPGVGKSFIAVDMALSIAHGRAWHDKTVDEGVVLYIAGEGVGGLGKRIKAWQTHYNIDNNDAPMMVIPMAVQFREQEDIEKLIRTIGAIEKDIKCIVIDTVARSMLGMEENSSQEIGIFVEACDSIKRMFKCAVLAIHHSGKDASRGMRGSNALLGACDTSLQIKASDSVITIHTEKQKDAEPIDDMSFALEQVALVGETSAVVKITDKKTVKKMVGSDRDALEALRKALFDAGQQKVRIEVWEEYHRLNSLDTHKSTRTNARKRLRDSGCIGIDNGFVWINKDLDDEVARDLW